MVYSTKNWLCIRSDGRKYIKLCPYNMTYNDKFMMFKLLVMFIKTGIWPLNHQCCYNMSAWSWTLIPSSHFDVPLFLRLSYTTWTQHQRQQAGVKVWIMFSFQRRYTWKRQRALWRTCPQREDIDVVVSQHPNSSWYLLASERRILLANCTPSPLLASCASRCLAAMGNAATAKKGNEQESGEHLPSPLAAQC